MAAELSLLPKRFKCFTRMNVESNSTQGKPAQMKQSGNDGIAWPKIRASGAFVGLALSMSLIWIQKSSSVMTGGAICAARKLTEQNLDHTQILRQLTTLFQ